MFYADYIQPYLVDKAEKQQSIFDHYSIENEMNFLRNVQHLSLAERQFYVRENILSFLGEYVGELPYKKINYLLKDGQPYFAGFPVLENYKKAAQMAGMGSREWSENEGFERAIHLLQLPNINCASLISPPKNADYGFVFHFVKEANSPIISEYILRYNEKIGDLTKSKQIARSLSFKNIGQFEDFLATPLTAFTNHRNGDLNRLLEILGISEEGIEDSSLFENTVKNDRQISFWLEDYLAKILGESPASASDLELIIGAIYNRAKELKDRLVSEKGMIKGSDSLLYWKFIPADLTDEDNFDPLVWASKRKLTVAGGSCPTTKKEDGLTSLDILEKLKKGETIEQIFSGKDSKKTLDCKCPFCGKDVKAEIYEGKIHCTKCGKSADYPC